MVWGGEGKAGHSRIGVGTDHWAVRQEKLPLFVHFRRVRTAYQRTTAGVRPSDSVGSRGTVPGVAGLEKKRQPLTTL